VTCGRTSNHGRVRHVLPAEAVSLTGLGRHSLAIHINAKAVSQQVIRTDWSFLTPAFLSRQVDSNCIGI
jgi:hypothetical protein